MCVCVCVCVCVCAVILDICLYIKKRERKREAASAIKMYMCKLCCNKGFRNNHPIVLTPVCGDFVCEVK